MGAEDTGFTDVTHEDEQALKEAVATIGPISIAIDASHESFQLYESGKFSKVEDVASVYCGSPLLTVHYAGHYDDNYCKCRK